MVQASVGADVIEIESLHAEVKRLLRFVAAMRLGFWRSSLIARLWGMMLAR